jgi:transposase
MKNQTTNKKKTPKEKKSSKVMPDVIEYIRLYSEENYPLREVARHFKVSVSTIYNAMTTAGFSGFRSKSSRCSHTRMSMEQQAIALFHVEAYE